MTATRFWMFAAALLLIVAAVFLWRNNLPAVFVTAALGACAWFLSYRTQLKAIAESTRDESEEHDQSDED